MTISNNPRKAARAMWSNDFDITRIGMLVGDLVDEHRSGLTFPDRTTKLPGRVGTIALAREFESSPRRIVVEAVQTAQSSSRIVDDIADMKLRAYNGEVELRFTDNPDRIYYARCESFKTTLMAPSLRVGGKQAMHRVRMTWLCQDPLAYDRNSSVIGFSTAKAEVPLGSAISTPTIIIHGPSTGSVLTLTYKDIAGVVQTSLKLSGAAAVMSSTEAITIDNELSNIDHSDGTDLTSSLTSTSGFIFFDPQDGAGSDGPWGTIELSAAGVSCEALYRRAWL